MAAEKTPRAKAADTSKSDAVIEQMVQKVEEERQKQAAAQGAGDTKIPPPEPEPPKEPVEAAEPEPEPPAEQPPAEEALTVEALAAELRALKAERAQPAYMPPEHVARLERRLSEFEERQAKEEEAKHERDLQILRNARKQALEERDFLKYDQIRDREIEISRELEKTKAERARRMAEVQMEAPRAPQIDPQLIADEQRFLRDNAVTREEMGALIALDRARMASPKYKDMHYRERWKASLAAVRGEDAPPAREAPPRPKMRSPVLRGEGGESKGEKETEISAKQANALRAFYGPEWKTKLGAKRIAQLVREMGETS